MGLLGPIVGRWYDRIGARPLVMIGSLLSAAASWFMLTFDANTPSILIPVAHIVLSLGLALLFTPLFTFSMSSVPPQFYSHASAIIGTIQQIAGAAGTALFVTLLTTTSIGAVAAGTSLRVATAQGIHAAFISGAVLSLVTIALTLLVRKPATEAELLHELEH
jgi:DHA2 family lincomycin resistance protein-like MFS transporter